MIVASDIDLYNHMRHELQLIWWAEVGIEILKTPDIQSTFTQLQVPNNLWFLLIVDSLPKKTSRKNQILKPKSWRFGVDDSPDFNGIWVDF